MSNFYVDDLNYEEVIEELRGDNIAAREEQYFDYVSTPNDKWAKIPKPLRMGKVLSKSTTVLQY